MKPPPFAYLRAGSVEGAAMALAAHGPEARLLAGGQSLLAAMNLRRVRPTVLIDLEGVPELTALEEDGEGLRIGAMVRQRTLETAGLVRERVPLLAAALAHVGYLQVRTRGTLGGSLAHADPAGELPAVALLLEATVAVRGVGTARTLTAADLLAGPFRTCLAHDEVLTEVRFPRSPVDAWSFEEVAVRGRERTPAGLAGVRRGGQVRLVAFGTGGGPFRLPLAEAAASGPGAGEVAAAAALDVSAALGHDAARYAGPATAGLVPRALARLRP